MKSIEFLVCRECGVYVAGFMPDPTDDNAYATLMVSALDERKRFPQMPTCRRELLALLESDANALPPLLNQLQVLAMQRLVGEGQTAGRPPSHSSPRHRSG